MNFDDLHINQWRAQFMGRTFPVSVGRSGIGEKKGEGDGITPRGIFKVETWLARNDHVRLKASLPPITLRDIWIDEAGDPNYNQKMQRPYPASHERLFRPDNLYNIIGVLNYNRDPIIAGRGSAIFIHAWRRPRYPTEGCIAFAPKDLIWIAENIEPSSRVIIQ